MNRKNIPNAAFAHIVEINGLEFKLARHHTSDVRDGTEHDTIDAGLLSFAINSLNQLPVSDEEREAIRLHLKGHEAALAADLGKDPVSNDVNRDTVHGNPDLAGKIINGDNDGRVDGNDSLKNPTTDMNMEPKHSAVVKTEDGAITAQLTTKNAGGNITGGGGTPTKRGVKDTDAGKPKGDHQDQVDIGSPSDVEQKGGKGTPAHPPVVSVGEKDKGVPSVENDGGEVFINNPGPNETPTVPVSKGSTKKQKAGLHDPEEDLKDDKGKKNKKGKAQTADQESEKVETKKGNDSKKDKDSKKKVNSAVVGDWVRNKDGVVGVITSITEAGKAKVTIPRGTAGVSQKGWQVIVKASDVNENDSVNVLANEMRILNSPEALKLFATPTPEGQAARNNKICLCSVDQLTDVGKDFLKQKFVDTLSGKTVAKVISVDKLGQTDFVIVRMGDEEFPFTVAVEVMRNGEGEPEMIRLLSEILPVEFMKDFAKFLTDLAKEKA